MKNNILWIRERFAWMGAHSGYDKLFDTIERLYPGTYSTVWRNLDKRLPLGSYLLLPRLLPKTNYTHFYETHSMAAELTVAIKCYFRRPELVHIAYVENNLGFLPEFIKGRMPVKIIGTAHQPAGWWKLMHRKPDIVSTLDALIVPASKEVAYFERFLPGSVHFIRHGVDLEFFRPLENIEDTRNEDGCGRCVFAGKWLRDTATLSHVIDIALQKNPDVRFDMIVPRDARFDPWLHRIARHEQVKWHSDLSDEELRAVYQKGNLLLMPVIDCTANNALVEGLACGLPIVSNDLQGMKDYTDDECSSLHPVGDAESMANAVLEIINDGAKQQAMGDAARLYAEKNLSWKQIAAQTVGVYEETI